MDDMRRIIKLVNRRKSVTGEVVTFKETNALIHQIKKDQSVSSGGGAMLLLDQSGDFETPTGSPSLLTAPFKLLLTGNLLLIVEW